MKTIQVKLATGLSMPPLGFKRDGEDWVLSLGQYVLHSANVPPQAAELYVNVHSADRTKGDKRISVDFFKSEAEAVAAWRNGFTVTKPDEGSNASPWVKWLLDEGILERV